MATKRFCDRCDKQLKPMETKSITLRSTNLVSNPDLCDRCFIQLQNWLKPDAAK